MLQSGRKEAYAIGNYVSKVVQAIQKAKLSGEDHFITEVAEGFVKHTTTGVEVIARLHDAPGNNIPDATITVHYIEKNGVPNVTVTLRQGNQDVPQHPSFQESGESDLERYLSHQLLAITLSL